MSRSLTQRERRLLALCIGVLVLMGSALLGNEFLQRRTKASQRIAELENEKRENETWIRDRAFWEKRASWLSANMPTTESLGRAQGQLLEEVQNSALDLEIAVEQQTLVEPVTTENYREVAVSVRLRGDQATLLNWVGSMQSPEKFQSIKTFEFEIDRRAREKTPQAVCNLTLARWFQPEAGL
jgi:hypothetical protein